MGDKVIRFEDAEVGMWLRDRWGQICLVEAVHKNEIRTRRYDHHHHEMWEGQARWVDYHGFALRCFTRIRAPSAKAAKKAAADLKKSLTSA